MRAQVVAQTNKVLEFMDEYAQVRTQLADATAELSVIHTKEATRTDVSTSIVPDSSVFVNISEEIAAIEPQSPPEEELPVNIDPAFFPERKKELAFSSACN
jgi:hypothetical protein